MDFIWPILMPMKNLNRFKSILFNFFLINVEGLVKGGGYIWQEGNIRGIDGEGKDRRLVKRVKWKKLIICNSNKNWELMTVRIFLYYSNIWFFPLTNYVKQLPSYLKHFFNIGSIEKDGQNGLKRIRIATIAALANEIKRQQGPRRRSGFKHPSGKT